MATHLVVGDIGGTNSRIAIVQDDGAPAVPDVFRNDAASGLDEILQRFLATHELPCRETYIRLAIACPVSGDTVRFTNRDWAFSVSALEHKLMIAGLSVVNDFTAIALALPHLRDDQMMNIGDGSLRSDAPKVVLGPGTGLGVAASIPVAGEWHPVASEGGHVTLAALCDEDARIIDYVRAKHGHVSAERLLTGPGLRLLYEAQSALAGCSRRVLHPEDVTQLAAGGHDPVAVKVMDRFFSLLGGVAGNLALSFGARGGVYLAGGVLQQIPDLLMHSGFRESFEDKGRFRSYLAPVATALIIDPQPALLGLSRSFQVK